MSIRTSWDKPKKGKQSRDLENLSESIARKEQILKEMEESGEYCDE